MTAPTKIGAEIEQPVSPPIMVGLCELRAQIEHASGRRADLLRVLSEGHDRELVSACARLDRRLAGLWEEHRLLRARLRYGEPAEIKQRARHEERVLRSA